MKEYAHRLIGGYFNMNSRWYLARIEIEVGSLGVCILHSALSGGALSVGYYGERVYQTAHFSAH